MSVLAPPLEQDVAPTPDSNMPDTPRSRTSTPTIGSISNSIHKGTEKETRHVTTAGEVPENHEYPGGFALAAILIGICSAVLLVALDQTIVATAIPKITNQFHSVEDIGWYASAYFLTAASLTAIWGKVYQHFDIKIWFLVSVGIFELGSLICGVAPNSKTLIVGRAIAGLGVSGIFSGALVIIAHEVELTRRSAFIGMIGGIYGISSIVGPLVGGAFTEKVTWRWCFYINLPVGALVIALVFIFVKIRVHERTLTRRERIDQLDLYGLALFIPTIICLLLALLWGGTTGYPWNSSKIIGLFVGAGVLAILFVALQVYRGDKAMLPPRLLRNRTVWACSLFAFFFTGDFFLLTYYIPIYFQSIKGSTEIHSAIQLLPFLIAVIISSIGTGGLVSKIGRYTPILIAGVVPLIVGTGLITTWRVDTGHAKWIAYQVIMGLGTGGSFQIPLTAIQATLSLEDIPTGTACIAFMQTLGGAIGVAVAQSLFINNLTRSLASNAPDVSIQTIIQAGATGFKDVVTADQLPVVREAYMSGITAAFRAGLVCSCLSLLFVVWVPWNGTVKKDSAKDVVAPDEGDVAEKV